MNDIERDVFFSTDSSFRIGVLIAVDYKYLFWTTPDTSLDYEAKLKECHVRSAARIAQGSIENGGLYVKMGQGLVTADHMVPKEYIDGLRILLDRALRRQRNEVRLNLLCHDFDAMRSLFLSRSVC